jgi:hypothetical protein
MLALFTGRSVNGYDLLAEQMELADVTLDVVAAGDPGASS